MNDPRQLHISNIVKLLPKSVRLLRKYKDRDKALALSMQGGRILAPEVGRIFRSETLFIHN